MLCPICKKSLEKAIFHKVEVDFCPICLGVFFEKDELRQAKDAKDKELNWLDIDLWKAPEKFKISLSQKSCPFCQVPLYEVNYGDSKISLNVCNLCQGIWLDRGVFKKIIGYLKEKAKYEILENYLKNLTEEFREIFSGPETLKEEVLDFLTVLKLLNYKFVVRHPNINKIISNLPK